MLRPSETAVVVIRDNAPHETKDIEIVSEPVHIPHAENIHRFVSRFPEKGTPRPIAGVAPS